MAARGPAGATLRFLQRSLQLMKTALVVYSALATTAWARLVGRSIARATILFPSTGTGVAGMGTARARTSTVAIPAVHLAVRVAVRTFDLTCAVTTRTLSFRHHAPPSGSGASVSPRRICASKSLSAVGTVRQHSGRDNSPMFGAWTVESI